MVCLFVVVTEEDNELKTTIIESPVELRKYIREGKNVQIAYTRTAAHILNGIIFNTLKTSPLSLILRGALRQSPAFTKESWDKASRGEKFR